MNDTETRLLEFIAETVERTGLAPTFAEMAAALGRTSKNAVHVALTGLERGGFIRRVPGRKRGIEVVRVPGRPKPRPASTAKAKRPARSGKELHDQLVRLSRVHGWDRDPRWRNGQIQAARLVGLSPRTMQKYLAEGHVPEPVARLLFACERDPALVAALLRLPAAPEASASERG